MNDTTMIAEEKTVADWKLIREKIRVYPTDIQLWEEAFDFLMLRLETRYFKPIKSIRSNDTFTGEGFAIMAILCSLIEFLETLWTGEIYRYCKDSKKLHIYEYSGSKEKFVNFLENKYPFNSVFTPTNKLATAFYKDVRCGLLHEAMTKSNWVIRVDNSKLFYEFRNSEHIVDRNKLENSLKEYLLFYKNELLTDVKRQDAFLRKFNNLAGLPINY